MFAVLRAMHLGRPPHLWSSLKTVTLCVLEDERLSAADRAAVQLTELGCCYICYRRVQNWHKLRHGGLSGLPC